MRVILLLLLVASLASAQEDYTHVIFRTGKIEFVNHHPACNPFALAFDPVWIHGEGWTMPRIAWHATYPAVNEGVRWGLEKVGSPSWLVTGITTFALPLGPHIRQMYLGLRGGRTYQLNLYDWFYDFHNRNLPNYRSKKAIAYWAVGDVALSCFARP